MIRSEVLESHIEGIAVFGFRFTENDAEICVAPDVFTDKLRAYTLRDKINTGDVAR